MWYGLFEQTLYSYYPCEIRKKLVDPVHRYHVIEYFQTIFKQLNYKLISNMLPIWRDGMLDWCIADIQISSVSHKPTFIGHNPRSWCANFIDTKESQDGNEEFENRG